MNVVIDLRAEMEFLARSVLLLLLLVRRANSAHSQRLLTEADLVRWKQSGRWERSGEIEKKRGRER